MSQPPNESPVNDRGNAGKWEISGLTLAAVLPVALLLCIFLLAWTEHHTAAVVLGVIGAIAAVPAGYFAGSSLRRSWGGLAPTWIALGMISWIILLFTITLAASLRLWG